MPGASAANMEAPSTPAQKFPARGQVRLSSVVSARAGNKAGSNKGPDPRSAWRINAYKFPSLSPIPGPGSSLCSTDVKHSKPTEINCVARHLYPGSRAGAGPGCCRHGGGETALPARSSAAFITLFHFSCAKVRRNSARPEPPAQPLASSPLEFRGVCLSLTRRSALHGKRALCFGEAQGLVSTAPSTARACSKADASALLQI